MADNRNNDSSPGLIDYSAKTQSFHIPYFSGSQVKLWIGEIYLDEVTDLVWTSQTDKIPVYGYASRFYDTIGQGRTLVQGSFIINFKYNGWLHMILNLIKNPDKGSIFRDPEAARDAIGDWVSRHVAYQDINKGDPAAVNHEANNLIRELALSPEPKTYRDFVEKLREKLWTNYKDSKTGMSKVETSFAANQVERRSPFDISITYGIPPAPEMDATVPLGSFTAKRIAGISLTSVGQKIELSGAPVGEQYSFIARATL